MSAIAKLTRYVLLLIAGLYIVGCGSGGVYVQTDLSITPEPQSQVIGTPVQLHVRATYSDGKSTDVTALATWTSSSATIAAMDSKGVLSCRSAGRTTITATLAESSNTTTVTCSSFKLTVSAPGRSLLLAHPVQATATTLAADGSTADVTTSATWAVSDPSTAFVSKGGLFTCTSPGSAQVTATVQGVLAGTTLTCTRRDLSISGLSPLQLVGQPVALHATVSSGNEVISDVTGTALWSTNTPSVGTVSSLGIVTCATAGSTDVTATTPDAAGTARVTCVVPQIAISGIHAAQPLTQLLQLAATASLTDGTSFDITTTAVWATETAKIANVGTHGNVTCTAPGVTQITAGLYGGTASIVLTCTDSTLIIGGLAALEVVNQAVQLQAVDKASDGTVSDVTTIAAWSSAAANVATVSGKGLLTCVAAGSTQIVAVHNGVQGSAPVRCAAPLLSIRGVPAFLTVARSVRLSAIQQAPDGITTDVSTHASWSSDTPTVASIAPDGTTTCNSAGHTVVTASADGASTTTTLTCSSAPTSITIAPSTISARVGDPVTVSAIAQYADGQHIDVSPSVEWLSQASTVSVQTGGVLTCNAAGTFALTASYLGVSQQAKVSCSPPSLNTPTYFQEASDEFVGPFPSWTNVKTAFGVIGDGVADDTAALQKALDSLNDPNASPVIWLPAGTYNVGTTLTIPHKRNFTIVGEDPATTRLAWIGAPQGTIFQTDGSTYYRLSRLTIDGGGVADTGIRLDGITSGGYYQTFVELSDLHLLRVPHGMRFPKSAEIAVERVYFDHLDTMGISVEDWNSLNIFITDSLFIGCGTGVSNTLGAGAFFVSNSYFKNSRVADMSIGNTGFFAARHNLSVGSKAFFTGGYIGSNPAQVTLQNNTVIDPTGTPLYLGNMGPLMLLDNVVRMQNSAVPYLLSSFDPNALQDVFSIGNTYTPNAGFLADVGQPFPGRTDSYDDSTTLVSNVRDVDVPSAVYTPPNLHRQVFEVADLTGTAIQQAVDMATNSGSPGAVVHLRWGVYHISSPIEFAEESSVQLVGDQSGATVLMWDGPNGGAILHAPTSNISVRNLSLESSSSAKRADGLLLTLKDQPNMQVITDQVQLQGGNEYSVKADGVEHATVEMFSTYTQGSVTGVSVTGGPFRAAHEGTLGVMNQYTGSLQSEGTGTSFLVDHFGKFMVQDNWHDNGATSARNFVLSGSGTVTEQSGLVGMDGKLPFEIDGFDGDVTLVGLGFSGGFKLQSGAARTNLLNLGMLSDNPLQPVGEGNLTVNNLLNSYFDHGGVHIPQQDNPDVQWMRHMLAQTRTEYPIQRLPLKAGAHRIRFSRIEARNTLSAIHYTSTQPPSDLYYTLSAGSGVLSAGDGGCPTTSGSDLVAPGTQWLFVPAGDGDYRIVPAGANTVLAGVPSGDGTRVDVALAAPDGSYKQRWLIQNNGDGTFAIRNRYAGLPLASSGGGACVALLKAGGSGSVEWTIGAH